jgi:predicted permease
VTALRVFLSRLQALVRAAPRERDLDDEIASHLAEATDEYIRQGLSPEDGYWAARRDFGGVTQTKEIYRQVRSFGWLEASGRDLRFAARMLMKDRWVTLAAVVALAIGIAANTTVFTIVNAILLRSLPFEEADRIVAVGIRAGNIRTLTAGVSYADFDDWRAAAQTFEGLAAMKETTMNVGDEGLAPERFMGSYVSANAFGVLRQQPLLGRNFAKDDDRRGATPVVILGDSLWRNRYASDPRVLGRTIRVNGLASMVVGVMPDGFSFPARSRLWQPLALLPDRTLASRGARDLSAFGRLAPDINIEQAVVELRGIAGALADQYPATNRDVVPIVAPYHERSVGSRGRSTLPVLMGVVAAVLLLACANVANLLLARAATRSHEMSVRMAIGAGRGQVVRQLLMESLLLATAAGAAGWTLSLTAIRAIYGALGGSELPFWIRFTIDERVFAFSLGITLATALLFGLVPALQMSKPGIAGILMESGRTTAGTGRSRRWAYGLVVFQLALTPMLLTGGGLMMRSIVAQYEMDPGVSTDGITWAAIDLPDAKYPTANDRARFYQQLDQRFAAIPGIDAALVSHAPFGGGIARNLWLEDEVVGREPQRPRVLVVTTGPRYLQTFRRRIVRGPELALSDGRDGAPSVIVNEWLAAAVFPGEDPIGRRIRLTPLSGASAGPEWFTIAGIAPNIRQSSTNDASGRDGVVYMSYGSNPLPRANIVARSDADLPAVVSAVREQVRAVDPDLPLFEVMALDDVLARSDERVGLRVFGTMFVVFAAVALLLATVGVYAVTAYTAAQRTREFGIRAALGAQAAHLWWLVARIAAWQVGAGLSIGMIGALGIGQLLGSMLVGTDAIDPVTLFAVAGLLAVVGLSASLVPARRAMRLDPAAVLRSE